MCEENGCVVLEEGRCMTTKLCKKNKKNFPGYNCIDECWNCNDCVYVYIEGLCNNIGCADQKEGRRMIKEECTNKMNESKGYPCHHEFCNGNDYLCSYQEQTLSEDIGCDDRKKGDCMTKKEMCAVCKKILEITCINDFCNGNDCLFSPEEQQYKKEGRMLLTDIIVMMIITKVTIVDAVTRNNYCVKISDVYIYNIEGRCMSSEKCDRYMNASNGYNCNDAFCKGNDCVCSYKEQPLCKDIKYDDNKEGSCKTEKTCK